VDNKGHWLPLRILAVAGALFNSYSVRKKGVSVVNEDILEIIWVNDLSILCFTSKRIIVAHFRGSWGEPIASGAASGGFEGFGAFVEWDRREAKKEKLHKLSPEGILKADRKNFAIPYVEITKVELFKNWLGQKLRITVGTKKHEFSLRKSNDYYKCMFALRPLLSNKLTVS